MAYLLSPFHSRHQEIWLSFAGDGGREHPLRQFAPLGDFCPHEIWSENNRKISITKEICMTIDFAPAPLKNSWKKARKQHFFNQFLTTLTLYITIHGLSSEVKIDLFTTQSLWFDGLIVFQKNIWLLMLR